MSRAGGSVRTSSGLVFVLGFVIGAEPFEGPSEEGVSEAWVARATARARGSRARPRLGPPGELGMRRGLRRGVHPPLAGSCCIQKGSQRSGKVSGKARVVLRGGRNQGGEGGYHWDVGGDWSVCCSGLVGDSKEGVLECAGSAPVGVGADGRKVGQEAAQSQC